MDEEFFQEFFNKDKEIGLLKEQLYQVQNSNDIMRKTINNLINMKCKRGESSYLLNIALDTSLREHTQTLDIFVYIKDFLSKNEFSWFKLFYPRTSVMMKKHGKIIVLNYRSDLEI